MKSNALNNSVHPADSKPKSAGLNQVGAKAPAGLILLGTVHYDPKGFSRTRAFLEGHGTDLILVEISPFSLQFRKEHSSELRITFLRNLQAVCQKLGIEPGHARRHVQIASILRQMAIPFEYRASASYARRAGARIAPVDYSAFSRKWIETWPEMISTENIEQLLKLKNSSPSISSLYAQAAMRTGIARTSHPEILPAGDAPGWQKREESMADKIATALRAFNPLRPVYIGGWWHLSFGGSVRTLREILGVSPDCCMLLDQVPLRSALEKIVPCM
jgi:hypothetical protein